MKIETIKAAIPSLYTDQSETLEFEKGYSAEITLEYDTDADAPWDNSDKHGPVSDWENRKKRPGELVLHEDRGSKRFYDFAEAVKIAKREGWDAKPYNTGTRGQRAHRAAMHDYEFLRGWCNDDWCYVGVITKVFRNGEEIGEESLWGVDSLNDYPRDVAAENITAIINADIKARRDYANTQRRERRERNYWAARDVVTVQS